MSVNRNSGSDQKVERMASHDQIPVESEAPTIANKSSDGAWVADPSSQRDSSWKARLDGVLGQAIDGKYELLELVGTGGMGAVFRAHNRLNRSIVAVKILHPHLASEAVSMRRFQLEAKAASRIEHPNSVSVHDFGIWGSHAYLVMDYLDGRSLALLIKKYGKLNPEFAVPVFVQACAGLAAAHKLGIFHRDVKPSNFVVLERPDGLSTKVCDFGLVKLKVQEGDTITGTGEVFGSPPYMSPEQCLGRRVDERSDIYSMGILMFETLMGFLPIKGNNALDTMRMQVSMPPRPLQLPESEPRISNKLASVIYKALAKEPDKRFQNMDTMEDALREIEMELNGPLKRAL